MGTMLDEALAIAPRLLAIRRDIHAHPELGFGEHRTAAAAADILGSLGARVRAGVGGSGVIADLGPATGPCVAIRADMDALPIREDTGADYVSTVPGIMHACGHDAHVACALGAAMLLSGRRLPGRIRFLIQGAEETEDAEGFSGAQRMIEDGALEGVDRLLSLHVDGRLETGRVGLDSGYVSGAVDTFHAVIKGRGGHGAHPDRACDPIWIASQVLAALYAMPSRRIDPTRPGVLSVGVVSGGEAPNVIPSSVRLSGTIRSMDDVTRDAFAAGLEDCLGIARALGGDYTLELIRSCPSMLNDPGVVAAVAAAAEELLEPGFAGLPSPSLGAEDFSYMTRIAPGAQFRLGTMKPGGPPRDLHTSDFDIDEAALPVGAALLARSALILLA